MTIDNKNSKVKKEYLFASDFDQTLSFNDSGFVLSEMLGIPAHEFERKSQGMAKLRSGAVSRARGHGPTICAQPVMSVSTD